MRHVLLRIAKEYGTPAFAYDLGVVRRQIMRLKRSFPKVEFLYSLKANPSLGLCGIISAAGFGADVSSAGELATALRAGFPPNRMYVSGPYLSPEMLASVAEGDPVTLSIDSPSELERLANTNRRYRIVLRLRPDFDIEAAVVTGARERFGIPLDELARCREYLSGFEMVGFHVFSGSQVLDASVIIRHFREATRLARAASDILCCKPELINLGGGFGVPYVPEEKELNIEIVGNELLRLAAELSPVRVMLELGRFLVAQAGWYLTSVVGHQRSGDDPALLVDGGTHQRADLCGVGLRSRAVAPTILIESNEHSRPTDVWGCLCMPSDILAEKIWLPPLRAGNILAFPNAGAYGLTASPLAFLCHPCPPEVAFEESRVVLLRERRPGNFVLEGQHEVDRRRSGGDRGDRADP